MDNSLLTRIKDCTRIFWPLAYISFGGPGAHIALLHNILVSKNHLVTEQTFSDLFSISQSLPGPASTELLYSVGLVYGGFLIAVYVFLLWSIPMFCVMTGFGVAIGHVTSIPLWATRLSQGLASTAIGLIAIAAWKLARSNAPDNITKLLLIISASISVMYSAAWLYPVLMIAGGIFTYGIYMFEKRKNHQNYIDTGTDEGQEQQSLEETPETEPQNNADYGTRLRNGNTIAEEQINGEVEPKMFTYSHKLGLLFFSIWLVLLITAIAIRATSLANQVAQIFSAFYFVGSIIFGGGPVVIPLLKQYTVDQGWVTTNEFVIGLALIQSLPGPNFNFSAYLGALSLRQNVGTSIGGAILSYVGIFLPGLLLKNALIPFWQLVRTKSYVRAIFRGVNAMATGLVFSAIWILWTQANVGGGNASYHLVIASLAFVSCEYFKIPAPIVVILGGCLGVIEYGVYPYPS
ncbi:chromate ion transporter [Umbelopsis sp. PMI_123]|nr:chromate ion transporter [Umbelopsis sp. PMI_123]